MPLFKGFRVNRTNGAGAGRGDQPYPSFSPRIPGPTTPIRIDGNRGAPMPPRDTKEARKANSAKAKEKALKSINKTPLTPDPSPFGSKSGFVPSEPARAYDSARYAEQRLEKNQYYPLIHKTAKEFKETDQDTVGSYIETGKSLWTDEGQKWVEEKGSGAKKKRDEEYG